MEPKVEITPEGTIRCASGSAESLHEFILRDGRVLYRRVRPDGSRLDGEYAEWSALSSRAITEHYHAGRPELRQWFHANGFTRERIDAMVHDYHAQKQRGRRKRTR
jgi:hypothetical protein